MLNNRGIIHVLPLLIVVAAIGVLSFLLVSSSAPFKNNLNKDLYSVPPSQAAQSSNYSLGVGYVTANRTTFDLNTAYNKISAVANTAYIQGNWNDWLTTNYFNQDITTARQKGLKIYLALDILGYNPTPRASVDIPSSVGVTGDFTSAQVRAKYLELVQTITQTYHPDYFVVLVEANLHKNNNPTSYAAYKSFYPTVYQAIKANSPNTKVAVSLVYGDITDPSGFDSTDKARFSQDIADFETSSDLLAVSVYPTFLYLTPANFPSTFMNELAGFSSRPLFLSETSWISQSFTFPFPNGVQYTIPSSPQDQASYVSLLQQSTQNAITQGKQIEGINFVSLIDPLPADCATLQQQNPSSGWFCSLGLIDGNGNTKTAYSVLQSWRNQLSNPVQTPKPTATATPAPTKTPIPTPSPTLKPTPSPTPVPTRTPSPSPTATPVPGSTIVIRAAGQAANGNPTMVLSVSGVNVGSWSVIGNAVNGVFQTFTYTSPVKIIHSQVRVNFTNDYWNPNTNPIQDRNLRVDKITIDGVDYQSESAATYVSSCSTGYLKTEWLDCNGYFQY